MSVVSSQPDPPRVFDLRDVAYSGDVLAAASEPHVTVVGGVDEPAADAHVHAAQDHDAARNRRKEDQLKGEIRFDWSWNSFRNPNQQQFMLARKGS